MHLVRMTLFPVVPMSMDRKLIPIILSQKVHRHHSLHLSLLQVHLRIHCKARGHLHYPWLYLLVQMLFQHHYLLLRALPLLDIQCLAMQIQCPRVPPGMKSTLPQQPSALSFNPVNPVLPTALAAQLPLPVSLPPPLRHFRPKPPILQITGRHHHIRPSNNNINPEFLPSTIRSSIPQIIIIAKELQTQRSPRYLPRSRLLPL